MEGIHLKASNPAPLSRSNTVSPDFKSAILMEFGISNQLSDDKYLLN